ncbi:DNA methyltransferase [Desulfobacterales bacterium HSG2]|nr:DNA methyltransferase [Desulfobacterales bacterium HSG2]
MQQTRLTLDQDRLNVSDKSRSNIFNWRGQFTPQFIDYLLSSFSKPGHIVIDPFSGSGTVLYECARRGLDCYGFEINPAAYAMSKFFTLSGKSPEDRKKLISALKSKVFSILDPYQDMPLFRESRKYRKQYSNLTDFSQNLFSVTDDKVQNLLAVNMLFIAESKKNETLYSAITNSYEYITNMLLKLPFTERSIYACLCDSRATYKMIRNNGDLVITSPPYINVFNYHQNYRAILETLGWDILKVAKSEIGSNRKNRGNRFRTVVQYSLEIELSLRSLWHSLKNGAFLVFVVGRESKVRGIPFYNGMIIKDIMQEMGSFEDITTHERQFTNRFGNTIKEDIIVAKKGERDCNPVARSISLNHLKRAAEQAKDDVKKDMEQVIHQIDKIECSPIFNEKGVLKNV